MYVTYKIIIEMIFSFLMIFNVQFDMYVFFLYCLKCCLLNRFTEAVLL